MEDNQTSGRSAYRWRLELAYVGDPLDHALTIHGVIAGGNRHQQCAKRCEVRGAALSRNAHNPTLGRIPAHDAVYGFEGKAR